MTVNRTTLLNLPLPVTGTESGTWGDTTNNGLTQYIDIAVAGMTSLTSSDFTAGALSLSNSTGNSSATNIAASSAQYGAIKVSSLAATSTITAPSSNRRYVIINADATYNLIIKASGQTGVTVVPGEKALVAFNGTDYVKVGGAAGGSTTQIQFNNAGVFGGSANLTWDGTNVQIGATGALRLADTDSSNYVAFKSPGTVASNVTWTLPSADGTNGQALTTNGSGTLAFSSVTTSPGGSTTQVQYNNSGAFGGSANFVFDGTNVGIGTTSPNTAGYGGPVLGIYGASNTGGNIWLTSDTTSSGNRAGRIGFGTEGNSSNKEIARVWSTAAGSTAGNLGGNLLFNTKADGGSLTERMRIDSSGNVGIGTSSPSQKLEVSAAGAAIIRVSASDGSSASLELVRVGAGGDYRFRNAGGVLFLDYGTDDSSFATLAAQFSSGGAIGVGTNAASSGSGITFPATQSASSDANTLDDYEEGTWTPTIIGTTTAGAGTYVTQDGIYTKIGRVVTVSANVEWSAHTGTGNMRISNLPFTTASGGAGNSSVTFGIVNNLALTAGNILAGVTAGGSVAIALRQYPTGGGAESFVPVDTAAQLLFSVSYFV